MLNTVEEKRLREDLDRHFKMIKFPTHEKDSEGRYIGDLQLSVGAGFAMSWREKQPIINYLLEQLDKYKTADEMKKITSLIEKNEHITKMDRKYCESLRGVNDLIRIATDVKDRDQLMWGVHKHLDYLIYGFDESDIDSLFTPELECLLKGDKAVAKRELREMLEHTLRKDEMIERARQVARQFKTISDYSEESLEDTELRLKCYDTIRAVGGVFKARELLNKFKVDSVKVVHHEDEVRKIIVHKEPEINLYDLYVAVFKVFSMNYIEYFEDKDYLLGLHKEIIKYIEKLKLPLDDIKATRAVKSMVEGKNGKKVEIDKSDIEFLIDHYDELKVMSPFLSQF